MFFFFFSEFSRLFGAACPPISALLSSTVVPWTYGDIHYQLEDECVWDEQEQVGFAGDWCCNGRAEGAFRSGNAIAERVLAGDTPECSL